MKIVYRFNGTKQDLTDNGFIKNGIGEYLKQYKETRESYHCIRVDTLLPNVFWSVDIVIIFKTLLRNCYKMTKKNEPLIQDLIDLGLIEIITDKEHRTLKEKWWESLYN